MTGKEARPRAPVSSSCTRPTPTPARSGPRSARCATTTAISRARPRCSPRPSTSTRPMRSTSTTRRSSTSSRRPRSPARASSISRTTRIARRCGSRRRRSTSASRGRICSPQPSASELAEQTLEEDLQGQPARPRRPRRDGRGHHRDYKLRSRRRHPSRRCRARGRSEEHARAAGARLDRDRSEQVGYRAADARRGARDHKGRACAAIAMRATIAWLRDEHPDLRRRARAGRSRSIARTPSYTGSSRARPCASIITSRPSSSTRPQSRSSPTSTRRWPTPGSASLRLGMEPEGLVVARQVVRAGDRIQRHARSTRASLFKEDDPQGLLDRDDQEHRHPLQQQREGTRLALQLEPTMERALRAEHGQALRLHAERR